MDIFPTSVSFPILTQRFFFSAQILRIFFFFFFLSRPVKRTARSVVSAFPPLQDRSLEHFGEVVSRPARPYFFFLENPWTPGEGMGRNFPLWGVGGPSRCVPFFPLSLFVFEPKSLVVLSQTLSVVPPKPFLLYCFDSAFSWFSWDPRAVQQAKPFPGPPLWVYSKNFFGVVVTHIGEAFFFFPTLVLCVIFLTRGGGLSFLTAPGVFFRWPTLRSV